MLKTSRIIVLLASMLILAGCIVQSVGRFHTKESACRVPPVAGEWRLLDEKGTPVPGRSWKFKGVRVIAFDNGGLPAEIEVAYFRAGNAFFLDSTAGEPAGGSNHWWTMHVFPVHVVSKIEFDEKSLTLIPIDYTWMEKAVKEGTVSLPHIYSDKDNMVLFTASPEEWMEFLKKYASDEDVFSRKNALRFIR